MCSLSFILLLRTVYVAPMKILKEPIVRISSLHTCLLCRRRQLLCSSYCYGLFFSLFFGGGVTCWRWSCPVVKDLSPHWALKASLQHLSRLFMSGFDWQVQSNQCALWGPKLTPVTHVSRHNARPSHPLDLPLCAFIELQRKLLLCTPRVIENMWLKKGRDVHQWTWWSNRAPERWYRHVASPL